MVIWLTGLSGSGKSTISEFLIKVLRPKIDNIILIDGDVIRDIFGPTLGYDIESRKTQIGRIQRLTLFLCTQNCNVIVSALYSDPILLKWNRDNLVDYVEVYVNADLDTVISRDVKGLYKKSLSGEVKNVVGIDIPWLPPKNPDLVLSTTSMSPIESVNQIIHSTPFIKALLAISSYGVD